MLIFVIFMKIILKKHGNFNEKMKYVIRIIHEIVMNVNFSIVHQYKIVLTTVFSLKSIPTVDMKRELNVPSVY